MTEDTVHILLLLLGVLSVLAVLDWLDLTDLCELDFLLFSTSSSLELSELSELSEEEEEDEESDDTIAFDFGLFTMLLRAGLSLFFFWEGLLDLTGDDFCEALEFCRDADFLLGVVSFVTLGLGLAGLLSTLDLFLGGRPLRGDLPTLGGPPLVTLELPGDLTLILDTDEGLPPFDPNKGGLPTLSRGLE